MVGWVFFRSVNIQVAIFMIRKMFTLSSGVNWFYPFLFIALGGTILTHFLEISEVRKFHHLSPEAWYTIPVLLCMIWIIIFFSPQGFNPFIYAQF
jgi:hypothetical protein